MIFTSFEFVVFFAVVISVRSCIHSFTVDKWFLLLSSYFFYMSWSIPYAALILLTSTVDFLVGVGLGRVEDQGRRKLLLLVSIVANLGVLGYFKYTNFVLDNIWLGVTSLGVRASHWHYEIILPVGISFFTFQSMTYTIETYRRNIQPCHSLRDFLLFSAFFPQLLAGPINRAVNLLPQFGRHIRFAAIDFETGLAQFAVGAIKKLVISDRIAPHVDMIFASPGNYDGFTLLQGLLGYAIQIYCDFSGYSDMAIGAARMLGFRFMENFQMPYSSVNITEFWRRWHISLSTWFRDYCYVSLGGNRIGIGRTFANLLITMLLCGLWHGASWNFVFWGGLHGVSLAIHKAWKAWAPLASVENRPAFRFGWVVFSRVLTLGVVLVGWVFFRAQSWPSAIEYLSRLAMWNLDGIRFVSPYIFPALVAVFLTHLLVHKDRNWAQELPQRSIMARVASYSTLAILIVCLGATESVPFIYFQF
ncbi:MAG: MBOAT family protein [Nitrospira sp.]|nr:MBOAT family protein [Nitrospira sp.]